jgi:hypothetical protein
MDGSGIVEAGITQVSSPGCLPFHAMFFFLLVSLFGWTN